VALDVTQSAVTITKSGDKDPELRITKAGDRDLRCLLVQQGKPAPRHNSRSVGAYLGLRPRKDQSTWILSSSPLIGLSQSENTTEDSGTIAGMK